MQTTHTSEPAGSLVRADVGEPTRSRDDAPAIDPAPSPRRPGYAAEAASSRPSQLRLDTERWTNEGGSFAANAVARLATVGARG